MSGEAILGTFRDLVRAQLGFDGPIERESELAADLGLDSVKLLTLVVELENAFRVALEPEDGEPLVTVGQVTALIERCLARQEASA